ncbi:alpha/beta hydrolase [Rhodococcus erythropolis]|uniref:alpha/beta fold hydrolase n=1 Tax=Rhodococcus erythropolis TaxID=1833 RepID=UPI001E35A31E|nr:MULTISPECIES: alpha/beta hydrolase [Rhodococcus erythropolis group]MCD2109290.1 alpha/beta hydrolase [Rhodococcus qingshengii]MCZ4528214.1 alpha/beta hydrolase [Rhodococcus erythropolis]
MRKLRRIVLVTVVAIIAIPVLLLATAATYNFFATRSEASDITSYGRLVPVDGKMMNVVVSGQGSETIVLLPGLGTAAPGLDYQPLITALSSQYKVVAVEPFGTGLSDQTDAARSSANIVREVHEALQYLGIDRYVLMGHSIAGIYALTYAAEYPDELVAFVGIDSSVPGQPGWDEPLPTEAIDIAHDVGLTRLLTAFADDPYAGLPYDQQTKEQIELLSNKNSAAPTLLKEMENAPANFASASGTTFPESLPVLLFVVANDTDVPEWVDLHRQQAASVHTGQVIPLPGEHYLHHTLSPEIARDTATFLASLPLR